MLCALDVSIMSLYVKLIQRDLPKCFLDILINWYSKSYAFVRWGCFITRSFQIQAGVRQGGILSPCLYAIFIDSVINKLRAAGLGASIGNHYLGCLLYADDILLVSHSVTVVQSKDA